MVHQHQRIRPQHRMAALDHDRVGELRGRGVRRATCDRGWLAWRQRSAESMAAAVWAQIATLIAVAVNQPLVSAIAEPRPYAPLPGVQVLAERTGAPGFPSDHAVMTGAVIAGLATVDRRLGVLAALAGGILAFSRIYIGAHYPHDVVVRIGLGFAVALIGWPLVRGTLTRIAARLISTGRHRLTTDEHSSLPSR